MPFLTPGAYNARHPAHQAVRVAPVSFAVQPLDRYRTNGYCTGTGSKTPEGKKIMEMPAAFILATNAVAYEFNSARPDAPVVPFEERPGRTQQFRHLLADGLRRAATAIAPSDAPAGPCRAGQQLHC